MDNRYMKLQVPGCNIPLKVTPGHFATNHSHINYYLDMTTLKTRQSEAQEVARNLASCYLYNTIVDTIVCLDGMEVIGAFLAEELTKSGVMSMNAHQTIYVVRPEFNSNSQMLFRENLEPMISGKNIVILMDSVSTGKTINKGIEGIAYYGGQLQGISAIFSAIDEVDGVKVNSVFKKQDVPDYQTYDYRECPYCQRGIKIDALVNGYGYSKL